MVFFAHPQTVDQAIEKVLADLPLKDRVYFANLKRKDLHLIRLTLGAYIRDELGFATGNLNLIESCRQVSGREDLTADEAFKVFIEELWKRLRKTHTMRVVGSDQQADLRE